MANVRNNTIARVDFMGISLGLRFGFRVSEGGLSGLQCCSCRSNQQEQHGSVCIYFGGGMAGSPCRNGATVFDMANPFTWSQLTDHVISPRSPGYPAAFWSTYWPP